MNKSDAEANSYAMAKTWLDEVLRVANKASLRHEAELISSLELALGSNQISDATKETLHLLCKRAMESAVMDGAVLAISNDIITKPIERRRSAAAGKRSGEVRAKQGQKARFIEWALALNSRP